MKFLLGKVYNGVIAYQLFLVILSFFWFLVILSFFWFLVILSFYPILSFYYYSILEHYSISIYLLILSFYSIIFLSFLVIFQFFDYHQRFDEVWLYMLRHDGLWNFTPVKSSRWILLPRFPGLCSEISPRKGVQRCHCISVIFGDSIILTPLHFSMQCPLCSARGMGGCSEEGVSHRT